jgi:hypothetical protein
MIAAPLAGFKGQRKDYGAARPDLTLGWLGGHFTKAARLGFFGKNAKLQADGR